MVSKPTPVLSAVDRLLGSLELDSAGEMRAEIARALASKLDEAALSESGAIAMATAGIAKELRAVVDAILEAGDDEDRQFVAGLFSTVGDP